MEDANNQSLDGLTPVPAAGEGSGDVEYFNFGVSFLCAPTKGILSIICSIKWIVTDFPVFDDNLVIALVDAGDGAVELHNLAEQQLSPKDERVASANPSPDAISEAPRSTKNQPAISETSGALTNMHPFNSYTPQEQAYYFGADPSIVVALMLTLYDVIKIEEEMIVSPVDCYENGSVTGMSIMLMPITCMSYLR
ncbi:UNVERIFIED_CONTAM: hypothetical protein Scaly_1700100 [Sesamum calycinum]|uniref:Uncharacterized protein n=1 Tax=Sesamum calycinum TaxID=2727403 RepID=A0AAW2NWK9_9LAMI